MSKIPAILVNYNYDPEWLKDYDFEVTMYNRSDDGVERDLGRYGEIIKTQNIGDVDADKLDYLVENYDSLPEVFLWSKTNLFKFIEEEEFKEALKSPGFKPLLTQHHNTYSDRWGTVNYYSGNLYHERADSWFFNAGLDNSGRFGGWSDWCFEFGIPHERYIPFAPGGSYLLSKERVHRYSRDFYAKMRDVLTYAKHPVEAHCCERSYYYLWR